MVTSSGAIATTPFYSSDVMTERNASVPRAAQRRGGNMPGMGLEGLARAKPSQRERGEQILELVVAAVTVVADIVTVALSRSRQQEKGKIPRPSSAPATRPPAPLGGGTRFGEFPGILPRPATAPVQRLEAIRSDAGDITVRTYDGYRIRVNGAQGGWSITAPDGKTTRVTDGSHVRESDGGSWVAQNRSSFIFGPHKVTLQPSESKKGAPRTSTMTVYSGSERITIGGLNTDHPTLEAVAGDGRYHDDAVNDGTTYLRRQTRFSESWNVVSVGRASGKRSESTSPLVTSPLPD